MNKEQLINEIQKEMIDKSYHGDYSTIYELERFENIKNYNEALNFIINELSSASKYKNRIEYSIQKIGKECFDILREFDVVKE